MRGVLVLTNRDTEDISCQMGWPFLRGVYEVVEFAMIPREEMNYLESASKTDGERIVIVELEPLIVSVSEK